MAIEARKGYMPHDINVLSLNNKLFFSAIWVEEESLTWKNMHGGKGDTFQAFMEKQVEEGFTLHSINTYAEGNTLKYAGVLHKQKRTSRTGPSYSTVEKSGQTVGRTLPIAPVFQQTEVWCWIAIGEMIFEHYGVPNRNPVGNYQCGIIGTILSNTPCGSNCFDGTCIIPSGSNYNTVRMLKDYAWTSARKVFSADEAHELSFPVIKHNIDRGKPILAGISHLHGGNMTSEQNMWC